MLGLEPCQAQERCVQPSSRLMQNSGCSTDGNTYGLYAKQGGHIAQDALKAEHLGHGFANVRGTIALF